MFDFAWSELALIAVVALLVIGPKDLPRAMRTAGMWVRKARAVAHEFQGSLEQMLREVELDEVRQQVEKASRFNVADEIARHIDPGGELRAGLNDPVLKDPLRHAPPAGEGAALASPPAAPALADASAAAAFPDAAAAAGIADTAATPSAAAALAEATAPAAPPEAAPAPDTPWRPAEIEPPAAEPLPASTPDHPPR